jgi:hypothetical protein
MDDLTPVTVLIRVNKLIQIQIQFSDIIISQYHNENLT